MAIFVERTSILNLLLISILCTISISPFVLSCYAESSPLIELNEFRWNTFPLNILVDMNQWSVPEYATVVREALDNWVKGIWNFTESYTDKTLSLNYLFYISNINSTDRYDIIITFTANELPPSSNVVGLTTYKWNEAFHEPIPSIIINITTYSRNADNLFIKNVVMHEFGHALGLGHALSVSTTNGPELMYHISPRGKIIYPSTLDIYGLIMLYNGNFGETVQLPPHIPYTMLSTGILNTAIQPPLWSILYPSTNELLVVLDQPEKIVLKPTFFLVPSLFWLAIAVVLGLALSSRVKGFLLTSIILVLGAYTLQTHEIDAFILLFQSVLLLPAIVIGSMVSEYIRRRIPSNYLTTN
jgi:hypothetical protein